MSDQVDNTSRPVIMHSSMQLQLLHRDMKHWGIPKPAIAFGLYSLPMA